MAKGATLYEVFGSPREALSSAAGELYKDGLRTAAAKSGLAVRLAEEEVRSGLEKLLQELDIVELAARGWLTLRDLQKYRDRQKYPPDFATVVSLADHTVRSAHHPQIDILLNGQPLTALTLDLDFSAVFEGFALTVQDARICRIGVGRCRAEASLSYKKNKLWSGATPNVTLPGAIDLGKGVPIPAI